MHTPFISIACAGVLGLIFMALSARVVMGRMAGRVMLGSGETEAAGSGDAASLFVAVRTHANFAEYVPLCLILMAGLEIESGSTLLVKALAAALILARISHAVGMTMKPPNVFRAGGFAVTFLVLLVASLVAVARVF